MIKPVAGEIESKTKFLTVAMTASDFSGSHATMPA